TKRSRVSIPLPAFSRPQSIFAASSDASSVKESILRVELRHLTAVRFILASRCLKAPRNSSNGFTTVVASSTLPSSLGAKLENNLGEPRGFFYMLKYPDVDAL